MLKNMVAVVTGAYNGLGRETAHRFVTEGASVVAFDIRDGKEDRATQYDQDKYNFIQGDVRSADDMSKAINLAKEKFGRLDYLINCAGIGGAYRIFRQSDLEPTAMVDAIRVLEINVLGTFNAGRLASAVMAENEPNTHGCRGVIINTSGFCATEGRIGQVGLAASHRGVDSLTLPMSRDLAPLGIRVATISPGFFETPLTSSFDANVKKLFSRMQLFPDRFGHAYEYTNMVLHILENNMINGEVIRLDAGLRMLAS